MNHQGVAFQYDGQFTWTRKKMVTLYVTQLVFFHFGSVKEVCGRHIANLLHWIWYLFGQCGSYFSLFLAIGSLTRPLYIVLHRVSISLFHLTYKIVTVLLFHAWFTDSWCAKIPKKTCRRQFVTLIILLIPSCVAFTLPKEFCGFFCNIC